MSKVIKNNTSNDILINDTGENIQALSSHTIDPAKYPLYARSNNIIEKLSSGDLVYNDGESDLSLAEAVLHLQGSFPKKVSLTEQDPETGGVQFTPRYSPLGWKQQLFELEFKTSTIDSIHEKDINNNDIGWASLKFYKIDNGSEVEIINPTQAELLTSCIRTDMLWMPNIDYMILSGQISQQSMPLSDLFVWGVGVDLDAALGGPQFAFAEGGINMDYVGERTAVGLKGVAGTILHYDKVWNPVTGDYVQLPAGGMGSNRIRFIVRHGAGMQHRLQPIFEIFRGD